MRWKIIQIEEKKPNGRKVIIRLQWQRYHDHLTFNRPSTYLILGQRGTGKSSLLETIASQYTKVFDIFGSADNESLGWCKPSSPFKKPLFIIGDDMQVTSSWDAITISQLNLNDILTHDVMISCHAFYSSQDSYFKALEQITTFLWGSRQNWSVPWFILIREAANWIYARMQIVKDSQLAKAYFVMMLREARHSGLAVGVDTLRWTSMDKEVRDISDFIFLKKVGTIGLPYDLRFIYRHAAPSSMMRIPPSKFVLLTARGAIAFGSFRYPAWHKEESEDLVKMLNLKIEQIEMEAGPKTRTTRMTTEKHCQLLKSYLETGSSLKTGSLFNVSTATIFKQIEDHNNAILKGMGYCELCKQHDAEFSKHLIMKGGKP